MLELREFCPNLARSSAMVASASANCCFRDLGEEAIHLRADHDTVKRLVGADAADEVRNVTAGDLLYDHGDGWRPRRRA